MASAKGLTKSKINGAGGDIGSSIVTFVRGAEPALVAARRIRTSEKRHTHRFAHSKEAA